jgi:hypothetical protein
MGAVVVGRPLRLSLLRSYGVAKLFRLADKEATMVYYTKEVDPNVEDDRSFTLSRPEGSPDDYDFFEVRKELTKHEVNGILSVAPSGDRDFEGGARFLEKFFEKVAVRWSLLDDTGDPLPPTADNYRNMDAAGAKVIDEILNAHLNRVIGRDVEELEEKASQ